MSLADTDAHRIAIRYTIALGNAYRDAEPWRFGQRYALVYLQSLRRAFDYTFTLGVSRLSGRALPTAGRVCEAHMRQWIL